MSDSDLSSVELSEGYVSQDELSSEGFIDDDEDFEDQEEKPKKKLSLKLKLPTKTEPKRATKRLRKPATADELPAAKRTSGRPKKAASYAEEYEDFEESYLDDDEDVIPTPALDAEGLSEDEVDYTPDVTKMTERQRAKLFHDETPDADMDDSLLALSNDKGGKKNTLTEEESQIRKTEIARKRRNLTEKKLEEEKQDTINKLLKRRAGKLTAKQLEEDDENAKKAKSRRPRLEHKALFTWSSKGDTLRLRVPSPLI